LTATFLGQSYKRIAIHGIKIRMEPKILRPLDILVVSGIECFLSIKLCFSLEKQIAVTELGPTFVLASALCGFAT
jgi:hypothetical protein